MKLKIPPLNFYELIIDGFFLFYTFIIRNFFLSGEDFFKHEHPVLLFTFYGMVAIFMSWYSGIIITKFKKNYSVAQTIISIIVLLPTLFFILFNLFSFVPGATNGVHYTEKNQGFIGEALVVSIFSIWSLLAGYRMGTNIPENNNYEVSKDKMIRNPFLILCIILATLFYPDFHPTSPPFKFLSLIGGIIIPVVSGILISKLVLIYMEIVIWRFDYILPVIIATGLIFWNETVLHTMRDIFSFSHMDVTKSASIFTLLFLGYIPFRVLLIFSPPVRTFNVIIGISVMLLCVFLG